MNENYARPKKEGHRPAIFVTVWPGRPHTMHTSTVWPGHPQAMHTSTVWPGRPHTMHTSTVWPGRPQAMHTSLQSGIATPSS
jgi:hypothetical protein